MHHQNTVKFVLIFAFFTQLQPGYIKHWESNVIQTPFDLNFPAIAVISIDQANMRPVRTCLNPQHGSSYMMEIAQPVS